MPTQSSAAHVFLTARENVLRENCDAAMRIQFDDCSFQVGAKYGHVFSRIYVFDCCVAYNDIGYRVKTIKNRSVLLEALEN
jgi:polygalacturonase